MSGALLVRAVLDGRAPNEKRTKTDRVRSRLARALSIAMKNLHPDNPVLHEIDAICSGVRDEQNV